MTARLALAPAAGAPVTLLVTGATTGAGASTVTANLACALRALGARAAVVDLAPCGVDALGPREWATLGDAVDRERRGADVVLLDAARVATALALDAAGLADRVLLVVDGDTKTPAAADGLRELFDAWPDADVAIVVNRAAPEAAEAAFVRLALARPAGATGPVAWLGHVPHDAAVLRARDAGRVLLDLIPHAPASGAFRALAARLLGLGPIGPHDPPGGGRGRDRVAAGRRGDGRDNDEVLRCA